MRIRRRPYYRSSCRTPPKSQYYYKISCPHCESTVYANVSDLWAVFGRLFWCLKCKKRVRLVKYTHTFKDSCKKCEALAECLGTPIIRVGTGTSIKRMVPSWHDDPTWMARVLQPLSEKVCGAEGMQP